MPLLEPQHLEAFRSQIHIELLRRGISLDDALASAADDVSFVGMLDRFGAGQIYPDELLSICESVFSLILPTEGL